MAVLLEITSEVLLANPLQGDQTSRLRGHRGRWSWESLVSHHQ
jgi:hypothetical protein